MSTHDHHASLLPRLMRAANRRPTPIAVVVCVLMAVPAALLGLEFLADALGPNPLQAVIRRPGKWALVFLLAVLTLTPLRQWLVRVARWLDWRFGRRLADWNWLIRLRRHVGLASFSYALLHLALYAVLDLGLDWSEFVIDLGHKPFVLAGIATFLLLLPLAITSTDAWMRRLKRNWKRLHWLVYPAAVLAILHFVWLSKRGVWTPFIYGLVLCVLLGHRLVLRRQREGVAAGASVLGDEVPERTAGGGAG